MECMLGNSAASKVSCVEYLDCEIQAQSNTCAIKQASDVGTAIFALVSAQTMIQNLSTYMKPDHCGPHIFDTLLKMADKNVCPVVDSRGCLGRHSSHRSCWPYTNQF